MMLMAKDIDWYLLYLFIIIFIFYLLFIGIYCIIWYLLVYRLVFTQSEMVNCRSVLEETVNNYQQNVLGRSECLLGQNDSL